MIALEAMCVCVCLCMCLHMCVCLSHVCVCLSVYVSAYVCVCLSLSVCLNGRVLVRMSSEMQDARCQVRDGRCKTNIIAPEAICVCVGVCAFGCVCMCVYMCVHVVFVRMIIAPEGRSV